MRRPDLPPAPNSWTLSDGYVLQGRVWRPASGAARCAVLYLHGIQSHGAWFEWSAGRLALAVRVMGQGAPVADLVMGDPSAYRGPQAGYGMQQAAVVPGSVALGFLAGFFGGCIGLGLVLAFAKGPATKRGAGIGFACQTVVGIGLRAAAH